MRYPWSTRAFAANDLSSPSDMGRDAETSDAHIDQDVMMNDSQTPVEDMSVPGAPVSDGGADDAAAGEERTVSDAQPSGDGR